MELGEKLLRARQEAGLSQRQLCGEEITRNMLSQIEHGTAKPSMGTLKYLASRLGKPVSYFLEEASVVSPNQAVMEEARRFHDRGEPANALTVLRGFREPDPVYDREYRLLEALLLLQLAERALREGRRPYARQLLEQVSPEAIPYCRETLERQKLLLLASLKEPDMARHIRALPSLDRELLLRAEAALREADTARAARLLDAMEDRQDPGWNLLRGKACAADGEYRQALPFLHRAEESFPAEAARLLEHCYRELEDFKQAYLYACKRRDA